MNQEYSENSKNPTLPDEDDEFGGASLSVDIIFRNRRKSNTCNIITDIISDEDENDEFGGAKNSVALIFKNRKKDTSTNDSLQESINTEEKSPKKEKQVLFSSTGKIFSPFIQNNQWLVDREQLTDTINFGESITIPLVIDTEFTERKEKEYSQKSRLPLTTQIKGISEELDGVIFALDARVNGGREINNLPLYPIVETDFHPIDYLNTLGLECEIYEATDSQIKELPKCYFVLYGHFLTAEINIICDGTVKERIKELQRSNSVEQISNGRRAYCQNFVDDQKLDYCSLKHIISINEYQYEVRLKLVDTGAIHGVAGYGDVCKSVGWELKYKDNFDKKEKSRMLDMAIERALDFENYARGDLDVYEALNAYNEQWKIVYELLGLSTYYQTPKLTIGGTVKDLFEASLAAKFKLKPTDDKGKNIWKKELEGIVSEFIKPASANSLKTYSTHTRALLAKVEGGRCRNNRPTDIVIKRKVNKDGYDINLVCDIDISGCYGEGQRNQSYFIGIPEIFEYKASRNNEYVSLRQWLNYYDVGIEKLIKAARENDLTEWQNANNWGELISGAWYARMSTKQDLKYPQDYFASWFTETADRVDLLAKAIRKMKCDSELMATDWIDFDVENGSLKIFNHQIWNGVLTHDGLQWILSIASPRQRNELLDNLQILASAVYPKSEKISVENEDNLLSELKKQYNNWNGKNTTERIKIGNGRAKIVMNFNECHTWYDINLGDLLINNLLIERKKAQKTHGKKSPLDQLFKLCVNTLYGDMVSKYFDVSNVVVGNNITSRARALAWYMEKGFNGWQSITDGCAFELNGVLFASRDNLDGETINQHRNGSKLKNWKIKRGQLTNVEYLLKNNELFIKNDDEINTIGKGSDNAFINLKAMEHLQQQFKLVDVLNLKSTSIKVTEELEVNFLARIGQFSFETKDVYHSGAFHGSANYILVSKNGENIKARGYEIKREHSSIEIADEDTVKFFKSDRYGTENNPAKDFLNQLLNNPENVARQKPAIKTGILKITDYKNLSEKYDELGIEPGDSIKKSFLMQEFSLSQFTFLTYEQYMNWKGIITHLKDTERQSLEGYFLNDDGSLDFIRLCNWVDDQIAQGNDKPFDLLTDKNDNDKRAEKRAKNAEKVGRGNGTGKGKKPKMITISHPSLETFEKLKEQLKIADNTTD